MTNSQLRREFHDDALKRDGVFTRREALDAGISDKTLRAGIESGQWQQLRRRGIYALAGFASTDRALLRAALIMAGPKAHATGPSALDLYGFDAVVGGGAAKIGEGESFLSLPRNAHVRIDKCVLLRDSERSHVHWNAGIRCVTLERAIVDSLRVLPQQEARAVMYRALQRRLTTAQRLEKWAERLRGCRGAAQLNVMAEHALGGAHAESEALLHELLTQAGLTGWVANHPAYDEAGLIGRIDVAFPVEKVAIEIDGRAWHSDHDRFERDRERNSRLELDWDVYRFTWEQLNQRPEMVLGIIRKALLRASTR